MSSSRLPGKVLLDIAGRTMLERVVTRAQRARTLDAVAIATTTDASDDPLAEFCARHGYACYRGSLFDVLDRYYQAALEFHSGVIVRLTADCPVIDPEVIDLTVSSFFSGQPVPAFDFAANRLPPPWKRTFPIGLDTEVCTFAALQHAWQQADQPYQREHVMPYLYDQAHSRHFTSFEELQQAGEISPEIFKVLVVHYERDLGMQRWTVDTIQDLELLRRISAHFEGRDDFSWQEVLALMESQPRLFEINAGVQHKTVHDVDERSQSS